MLLVKPDTTNADVLPHKKLIQGALFPTPRTQPIAQESILRPRKGMWSSHGSMAGRLSRLIRRFPFLISDSHSDGGSSRLTARSSLTVQAFQSSFVATNAARLFYCG
jgi:hypothetical protein